MYCQKKLNIRKFAQSIKIVHILTAHFKFLKKRNREKFRDLYLI